MKKFAKIISMFFTVTFFFFCCCFSGCVVFPTGDGSAMPSSEHEPTNKIERRQESEDKSDDVSIYDDGYYDNLADFYYGVRAVYNSTLDENYNDSSNTELDADRDKFNEVVLKQYEIISTYILYELIGEYGVTTTNRTMVLRLYTEDARSTYSPSVSDVEFIIIGLTNTIQYVIERKAVAEDDYDWANRWLCSYFGGVFTSYTDYADNYLNKYTKFLQMRLIETEYNLDTTTLVDYDRMSDAAKEERLNSYALLINQMGVSCSSTMIANVISIIKNEIIGNTWITNNDIGSTAEAVVTRIVNEIYSPYETISTNFATSKVLDTNNFKNAQDFPTFDRREFVDIDANKFFTPGIQGQNGGIDHLTNMEYQEYQSAVAYNKTQYFPIALQLSIDSISNLEMDIYIRICHNGTTNIWYLGKMHTDSTKGFDTEYESNDGEIVDENQTVSNTMAWQISDIIENGAESEDDLLDCVKEYYQTGLNANSQPDLYSNSGTYKDILAYKTTQYSEYIKCNESVVNKADADLSQILVTNDKTKDFIEIIFDVKKDSNVADNNYKFKFIFEVIDGNTESSNQEQ